MIEVFSGYMTCNDREDELATDKTKDCDTNRWIIQ